MNKIWVYLDHFMGEALGASWEALGAAQVLAGQLGSGVTAVVFGQGLDKLVSEAFQYGAADVLVADDATLRDFRPEPFTSLIAKLAAESAPNAILFPTTTRGRELAAMAAIGSIIGSKLMKNKVSSVQLKRIIGILLWLIAAKMIFDLIR